MEDLDNVAVVSLEKDAVYVVKRGALKEVDAPDTGFGENLITWEQNKIHAIKVSSTEIVGSRR